MSMQFVTNCVMCKDVDALNEMQEAAIEITYAQFINSVGDTDLKRMFPQYAWDGHEGLRLEQDWHVAYYKSKFYGHLCYYIVHSAIEWIFQAKDWRHE